MSSAVRRRKEEDEKKTLNLISLLEAKKNHTKRVLKIPLVIKITSRNDSTLGVRASADHRITLAWILVDTASHEAGFSVI